MYGHPALTPRRPVRLALCLLRQAVRSPGLLVVVSA